MRAADNHIQSTPPLPVGESNYDYWYSLIPEYNAAEFIDQKVRTLQDKRQRGGGPKYVRISARCVKYRRIDLKEWADNLLRKSTSDTGEDRSAA